MGDSGSMTLGFVLSAVALGIDYSQVNPLGVYAPLFILMIPMYDTFFVMFLRLRKGQSPFLGSKDHFALRMEKLGYSRRQIVAISAAMAALLSFCAFLVTQLSASWAVCIYAAVFVEAVGCVDQPDHPVLDEIADVDGVRHRGRHPSGQRLHEGKAGDDPATLTCSNGLHAHVVSFEVGGR